MPCQFATPPDIGIGYSWQLALQLAVLDGKTFGQEFVFTHGPLGYLLIRALVNKALLLLFDLYILCSLLCIYRDLLLTRSAGDSAAESRGRFGAHRLGVCEQNLLGAVFFGPAVYHSLLLALASL